ncbi:MAG TPA: hypothetical protein VIU61_31040 [Kofleriaceae bacterium]
MMRALAMFVLLALCATATADRDDRDARADDRGDDDDDDDRAGSVSRLTTGDELADDVPAAPVQAPAIGEVLETAYQVAGLDRNPATGWNRRARLAGLVPWISVRFGRDASWNDLEPEIDHDTAVEVRATWRLDRLVFDGRELQVSTIDTARRRERRRLASRVIRTYFAWRRLAAASVRRPGLALRAEEAAAELDAVTDGWFTDELSRRAKP